ncbi:MAG: exodeoxyribonuclease [Chlorobi bacterium]|nr:exodeoxyribonuclease [Chlorobiota bacterium]
MTVATWNVNGIRARETQFIKWMEAHRPDVICLQEIKATTEQLPASLADLPDYWSCWHGASGGYSGVSLHLKKETFPEKPVFSHPPFDHETRIVQAAAGNLILASVYIPNGGKDYDAKLKFMAAMEGYVSDIHDAGQELILSGDMNVARTDDDIHPTHNKPGIIGTRPDERELMERMFAGGLDDVARMLDPDNKRLFTWWPYWRSARERNLGWRIDYIAASHAIAARATACMVFREFGSSDHAPVMATFDLPAGYGG